MRRTSLFRCLFLAVAFSSSCGDGGDGDAGADGGGAGEPSGSGGDNQAGSSSGGSEAGQAGARAQGGEGDSGSRAGAGGAGTGGEGPCSFTVASTLSPTISTVGIVEWSTELGEIESAHVEFGLDTTYGMRAPVELSNPRHRTLLLGMKPSRTYHFRVVAEGPDLTCSSEDFTLTTGALPDDLPGVTRTEHAAGPPRAAFSSRVFSKTAPRSSSTPMATTSGGTARARWVARR